MQRGKRWKQFLEVRKCQSTDPCLELVRLHIKKERSLYFLLVLFPWKVLIDTHAICFYVYFKKLAHLKTFHLTTLYQCWWPRAPSRTHRHLHLVHVSLLLTVIPVQELLRTVFQEWAMTVEFWDLPLLLPYSCSIHTHYSLACEVSTDFTQGKGLSHFWNSNFEMYPLKFSFSHVCENCILLECVDLFHLLCPKLSFLFFVF